MVFLSSYVFQWLLLQFTSGSKSIVKSCVDSDDCKVVFSSVLGLRKFIILALIFLGIDAISSVLSDQCCYIQYFIRSVLLYPVYYQISGY